MGVTPDNGESDSSSRALGSISRAGKGGETKGLFFVNPSNPNRQITLPSAFTLPTKSRTLKLLCQRWFSNDLYRPTFSWLPFQEELPHTELRRSPMQVVYTMDWLWSRTGCIDYAEKVPVFGLWEEDSLPLLRVKSHDTDPLDSVSYTLPINNVLAREYEFRKRVRHL